MKIKDTIAIRLHLPQFIHPRLCLPLFVAFVAAASQVSPQNQAQAATPSTAQAQLSNTKLPSSFSGLDLTQADDKKSPTTIEFKSADNGASKDTAPVKGTVLVFLSARCPCSSSHEGLLNELQTEFKEFRFIGIHANQDEPLEESRKHFADAKLKFPVLQDKGAQYADAFKAFKTPHAFVLSSAGEILYQGGVTDSHSGPNANNFYLKQVLSALHQGKSVPFETKRALGCVISRKEKLQ